MDKRFEKFFTRLMKYEGVYSDDPDDAGGETKYGISQKAYPNINIKELRLEDAKLIYLRDYYVPMKISYIVDDELAWQVFDFGVNAGAGRSVKMLQNLVGAFPDGSIGKKTLAKIDEYYGGYPLWVNFVGERVKYYVYLTIKRPKNKKFKRGWLIRALEL